MSFVITGSELNVDRKSSRTHRNPFRNNEFLFKFRGSKMSSITVRFQIQFIFRLRKNVQYLKCWLKK